jgi:hypothetical protein
MIQSNINQRLETHIYRQRDDQGNLLRNVDFKDVFVPFKIFVPAGYSTFDVPIPKTYLSHQFSFDNLMLIPDFYEQQAALFDEDTEEDWNEILTYPLQIKMFYNLTTPFYGPTYVGKVDAKGTRALIKAVNVYFEFNKPSGIVHTGFYFDWYDLRFDNVTDETMDEYIQKMALTYYDEPYDVNKHYNALPESARSIKGANNYLLPVVWSEENLANIRVRMNIAPNTKATFSTNKHLNCMGFTDEQIGKRYRKQFVMGNFDDSGYLHFLADDSFKEKLTDSPKNFKLTVNIQNSNYETDVVYIKLTKREAMKNENYQVAIQRAFDELKEICNFEYGVNFDANKKNFKFHFPTNSLIFKIKIIIPPNLAVILGFIMFKDITPVYCEGQKIELPNVSNLEEKSRALVHDTGLVIVSDYNTGTNTNSGIGEQYMAALYPTETGSMIIHMNELCHEQPIMNLRATNMSHQMITATFLLSKFSNDNSLIKLIWKEGFKIQGTLRGVHPLKNQKHNLNYS